MLFDLEDYYNGGVIGDNQTPMNSAKWDDCFTTYRATREAFHKGFNEWIDTQIDLANRGGSACITTINELVQEYEDNYDTLVNVSDAFWNSLVDVDYNKEAHKIYSDALDAMMYSVRKLLSIFEGDKVKVQEA
jgi:hypothetical protein